MMIHRRRRDPLPWIIALLALGLSLILARMSEARWPNGSTRRIADAAPAIEDAAAAYDIAPELLAALAAHETGFQRIKGRSADVWGCGQVSFSSWAWLLTIYGLLEPGEGPEVLLEPGRGLTAAAAVLSYLDGGSRQLILCRYGMGPGAAKAIRRDCEYSRGVVSNVGRARFVLAVSGAVRSRFGGACDGRARSGLCRGGEWAETTGRGRIAQRRNAPQRAHRAPSNRGEAAPQTKGLEDTP